MESLLCLDRKRLADFVDCTVTNRGRFLAACGRLAGFRTYRMDLFAEHPPQKKIAVFGNFSNSLNSVTRILRVVSQLLLAVFSRQQVSVLNE